KKTLDSPERRECFLREAKAVAGLQHPHIVPVFEWGDDGTHYYIASAYIEGPSLAKVIDKEPSWQQAVQIVRQLAEALAYAHSKGIVHRDVKPANVKLDAQGQPHLLDFGLAYEQGSGESVSGFTVPYISPEQAADLKAEPQPQSDQYSLGVVL